MSDHPHHLTLEATARRVGAYVWVNRRLFEVLGAWARTDTHPDAQALAGTHCYQLAWHAELFEARLPRLRELPADQFIQAPNLHAVELFESLASVDGTLARLSAAYRAVLPRLAAAYTAHREIASPLSDAAVIRSLTLAMTDVAEQWKQGEFLVQQLVTDADSARRAAQSVAAAETNACLAFRFD